MKKHKTGLKFILFMVVCLALGVAVGAALGAGGDAVAAGFAAAQTFLQANALWLMIAAEAGLAAWSLAKYAAGRRAALQALAGSEDEELFERADRRYGRGLSAASLLTIIAMVQFGVGVSGFPMGVDRRPTLLVVFLLAGVFGAVALQALFVRATKQLYPEKRGEVLDRRFQQQWYESCDEAERQRIGQAAYFSMLVTGRVMVAVFAVLCLLSLIAPIGVTPILTMGVLWLSMTGSYLLAAGTHKKKAPAAPEQKMDAAETAKAPDES